MPTTSAPPLAVPTLPASLPDALQWEIAAAADPAGTVAHLVRAESLPPVATLVSVLSRITASAWARDAAEAGPALSALVERHGAALRGRPRAELLRRIPGAAAFGFAQHLIGSAADDVELLRVAVDLARAHGSVDEQHGLLTRLALADGSAAAVQAAFRAREAMPTATGRPISLAFLASFTVDVLAAYADAELRAVGFTPRVYIAPFNTLPLEVRNPASGTYASAPDIAVVAVAGDDLLPQLAEGLRGAALREAGERAVDELLEHVRVLSDRCTGIVLVHSLDSAFVGSAPLDWTADGRGSVLRELNARLAAGLAAIPRARIVDVTRAAARRVGGRADDPKMRYLAGMRVGDGVLPELAQAYVRTAIAAKGLTKKCLVLDLDNTLWGGIVGEDGPTGIRLGNTSPGLEYREFQQGIAALSRRGILLAVNSKNNPDDALEVIRNHPWMLLREDAFSAVRINWESKVENLRSIAAELNIGVDSLVFADDNPVECERVRQFLPGVLTVQLPRDPSLYRATLDALPWFDTLDVTNEDLQRVEQYRANRSRDGLRATTESVEDYLHSLEIRVALAPVGPASLARVVQLLNRTNQFNLTTRRYTQAEVEAQVADLDWHLLTLRARDRFGDHGLVAFAAGVSEGSVFRIDSFLMSCRVIGQGIEAALLAALREHAESRGATEMRATFIPTKKNMQVREFYDGHGFAAASRDADGTTQYVLPLPAALPWPAWITREST